MKMLKSILCSALLCLTSLSAFSEVDGNMAKYEVLNTFKDFSKTYKGYKVNHCVYPKGTVNFCSNENLKNIYVSANRPQSTYFMNDYIVLVIDSANRKTSSFVLVNKNSHEVITSPYEFSANTRVSYNTQGVPEIYIYDSINSFEYSGAWGSPQSPVTVVYNNDGTFYPKAEM